MDPDILVSSIPCLQYLRFAILLAAGWINRDQQKIIDYLLEEIRVYRKHLKGRRVRFTDEQRRRLGVKAKHWDTLAALDFFTIEVLTVAGISRYHVLLALRLNRVEHR